MASDDVYKDSGFPYTFVMANSIVKQSKSIKKKPFFEDEIITLCINNEKELYNKFSFLSVDTDDTDISELEINDEVINYLEKQLYHVPPFFPVKVELRIKQTSEENFFNIEKLIKHAIQDILFDIEINLAKMRRNSVLLIIAGIIPLSFRQIFSTLTTRYALSELFLVMAWVFMWKAVEILFFSRPDLTKRKSRLRRLLKAEYFFTT